MTSDRRRKLEAELRRTKAKLDSARAERDLMKAVAEGLHAKVLKLEAELSRHAGPGPRGEWEGGAGMAAEPLMSDGPEPEEELEERSEFEEMEELAEAQARADRLAARVSELRLQLSLFVPESQEEMERASEAVANVRLAGERIQALEMQLANARTREEGLTSQIVRLESGISDLESQLSELSAIADRVAEADEEAAEAGRRTEEIQRELAATIAEGEKLRSELEQARDRAEAERVLAAADKLRAEEAGRMLADLRSRAGDVEGALARISDLEAELARAVEQAERSAAEQAERAAAELAEQQLRAAAETEDAPVVDVGPSLAPGFDAIVDERDALRAALEISSARLEALEEVAEHAIFLETEMQEARSRLPEIRAAADAASNRIVELRASLEEAEAERDAARDALDARLADEQRLRERVEELERALEAGTASGEAAPAYRPQTPLEADIQARIHRFLEGPGSEEAEPAAGAGSSEPTSETGEADAAERIWLGDGVGEIVDISEQPSGEGEDEDEPEVTIDIQEHEAEQGSQ